MIKGVLDIVIAQRSIFGVCPCCERIFRMSDCAIFTRTRRPKDWMAKLDATDASLYEMEMAIEEARADLQEKARAVGRRATQQRIRRIDPIFTPLKLHADDAKILAHPVDYIVFDKMNTSEAKTPESIIFLDRERTAPHQQKLQRSMMRTIEKGQFDWLTLRVRDDQTIVRE
jgi:predicted Holliday junction resolvase-like endonuclease